MEFQIKNIQRNINDIMRTIGYKPAYFQQDGEISIVRQLSRNDYPRFHLYVKQSGQDLGFSLHLDQKKPSYLPAGRQVKGYHAHSGDYDGEVVESEAERIQQLLN